MQKWEYLTVSREWHMQTDSWHWADRLSFANPTDMLKELGSQGWELVSVLQESTITGASYAGRTSAITWYFKRPSS